MRTRAPFTYASLIIFLLALAPAAAAQEREAPKVEFGVQYTSLSINLPGFRGTENAPGFGARVTYNFNDYFAVEAEGNLLPAGTQADYTTGGSAQQVQAGLKAGKRWNRFGLFAKARPGFVTFSRVRQLVGTETINFGGFPFTLGRFEDKRKTHFSMDVGGVLEFYPSRRMLVRFDAGDTIIRFGEHREPNNFAGAGDTQLVVTAPSETTHNFQFTGGVAFRFGGGADDEGNAAARPSSSSGERVRRFEVGAQFSSLMLRLPARADQFSFNFDDGSQAEAGGGARAGFNATNNLAFEVEGNFYPRRRYGFDTAVGGYPSQLQAGVKYGRRLQRFGLFGKARPGFVNFSDVARVTRFDPVTVFGQQYFIPVFEQRNKTYLSMDVGGVFEFYPKRRVFTRFDVGDTMIRYPERDNPSVFSTNPAPPRLPSEVRHNLQVTAGLGFRF